MVVFNTHAVVFWRLTLLLMIKDSLSIFECQYGYLNLVTIPLDIPSGIEELCLSGNSIYEVKNETVFRFQNLKKLDLSHNVLTEFPDVQAVGETLESIILSFNVITHINPAYVNALVKIKTIDMAKNNLIHGFPYVTGPAETLDTLLLSNSDLQDMPPVNQFKNLKVLKLQSNYIRHIDAESFQGLTSLKEINLAKLQISEVPDLTAAKDSLEILNLKDCPNIQRIQSGNFAQLQNVVGLNLNLMKVKLFPTLCSRDVSALSVRAHSSDLDVCDCQNAWMKQAVENGAMISMDDKKCGDRLWSEMSLDELLKNCTNSRNKTGTYYYIPISNIIVLTLRMTLFV